MGYVYKIDETYFDKIDTEYKAYILGLIYADGCIKQPKGNRQKQLSIVLQEEDKDIQMENEVMLGLRKFDGINLDEFKEKFNVLLEDVYDIDDLVRDGYLIKENNYLKINKKYMYISNEVIVRMFK